MSNLIKWAKRLKRIYRLAESIWISRQFN